MKKYLIFSIVFLIYITSCVTGNSVCNKNSEKPATLKLREHILCDYDKTVRSVVNTTATHMEIRFLVFHFDFREYVNSIVVYSWFVLRWTDEHIYWHPEEFNNIEHAIISSKDIWIPDFSLYNSDSTNSRLIRKDSNCLAFYDKKVICVALASMRAKCIPDYRHWPFDTQNCSLRIGSWYHSSEEITIDDAIMGLERQYFTENPEWSLELTKLKIDPGVPSNKTNITFPTLNINVVIKRKSNMKVAILIVPFMGAIIMNLVTLWIDPIAPDRIYIMIVNIPLHIMLILNIYWDTQISNSIPFLILFIRNSQIMVTLTLFETIFVRFLLKYSREVPKRLIYILNRFTINKIGQLLLTPEMNPDNVIENLTTDEHVNLVEIKDEPKEWLLIGRIVDRLCFLLAILAYFIMFIICIPK